jgi:hypothetical protein
MANSARILLALSLLVGAHGALASPRDDACSALRSARIHLIAFMGATDAITLNNHRQSIQAASARLDANLAGMMWGEDGENASRASLFRPVWEAFKATRETEIIPAVLAGRPEDARQIALGIQSERMKQMKSGMGCK